MTLSLLLNTFGLCIGFISALFFAAGALTMSPAKIQKIATSYWDANQHWADSLADQRADYIVGAFLLLISFSLQLAGSLMTPYAEPDMLQPISLTTTQILAPIALLVVGSFALRYAISKRTRKQVREIQAAVLAAEDAERENRRKK